MVLFMAIATKIRKFILSFTIILFSTIRFLFFGLLCLTKFTPADEDLNDVDSFEATSTDKAILIHASKSRSTSSNFHCDLTSATPDTLVVQRQTKKCAIITFEWCFTKSRYIRNHCFTISLDNEMKVKTFCNLKNRRDKIIRQFVTNHIIFCFSSRLRFKEIV